MARRYSFSALPSEQAARAVETAQMHARELRRECVAAASRPELILVATRCVMAIDHAAQSLRELRKHNAELRAVLASKAARIEERPAS